MSKLPSQSRLTRGRRADVAPIAYTVDDAARALSCGRDKIYKLIATGELQSFTIGKRGRRIPVEAIEALARGMKGEGA